MQVTETTYQHPVSVIDSVETFLAHRWRLFILPGQNEPFVWDASSEYLVKVSPELVGKIGRCEQHQSLSLKEALRR
ncbi:hypothetical protein [Fischerella sp. PCC 9605]|uniref:hypothetical protein n=1 Tax=Fischerella sp. PCC 9605 TaxID=1173024 RepID=UPI00047AA6A1|nr:hypothetical protein [Fischerella sp. PCC 9605]